MRSSSIITPHADCTGCMACVNACPRDAISVREDACGYEYPEIDLSRCVDCGLCERVCPVRHPAEFHEASCAYAAASLDGGERASCSSGGMATVAGRYVLEQGGVVYGCAQLSYREIRHVRVDSPSGLGQLKGSKYVQSEIRLVYRSVKKDLEEGRPVLFSGTPCQVAGLKGYLRKDYPHLYTLDLVCHGVPPRRMLREDVESYPATGFPADGRADTSVQFRWKTQYGIQFGVRFGDRFGANGAPSSGGKRVRLPHDPYILAFSTGLSFRENCHHCPYSRLPRVGDLTVGDFWGLGAHEATHFRIREGVSLVLANTPRGAALWELLRSRLDVEERTVAEAAAGNWNLRRPSPRPSGKERFLAEYARGAGLARACRAGVPRLQYLRIDLMERLKQFRPLVSSFKRLRLLVNRIRK